MKKIAILLLLVFCSLALAKSDIGFKGVGGQVAFVMPEDPIESTIGFGGNVYLGKLMPELKMFAYVDYWGKSYGSGTDWETKFYVVSVNAVVRYGFNTKGNIKPYAGGGLGLNFASSSVDYKGSSSYLAGYGVKSSASSTDFGLLVLGGASTMLSPKMEGFAEVRYNVTDIGVFGIYAGITYMLK
jgi:opacity protein-like surface antigen